MIPTRLVRRERAVARFGAEPVERLGAMLGCGDEPADRAWEALRGLEVGARRRRLGDAVAGVGPDDEELAPLLREFRVLPDWAALDDLAEGSRFLFRLAPLVQLIFVSTSLPLSYASPSGNLPLLRTGELLSRARLRLLRTSWFTLVTASPHALRPGGEGWWACLELRLQHAAVRRRLVDEGWDEAEHGVPLNQADMAFTILLFCTVVLDGLRDLGVHVSPAQGQRCMRVSRLIGHLIGVRWQCDSEQEGHRLLRLVRATERSPNPGAVELTRALHDALLEEPLGGAQRWLHRGVGRGLLGEDLAAGLGLGDADLAGFRLSRELGRRADRLLRAQGLGALASRGFSLGFRRYLQRALAEASGRSDELARAGRQGLG